MRDTVLVALAILAHAWVPRIQAPPMVGSIIGWLLAAATAGMVLYSLMHSSGGHG